MERLAGAAVHAVQLSEDLQRSGQRLVIAREEERRRLRRDLHDGLGPQLATLTLKIDAARNLLDQNLTAAGELLNQLKGGDEISTGGYPPDCLRSAASGPRRTRPDSSAS